MKQLLILIPFLLTACGTTRTTTMAYQDLNYYKVDCKHPADQYAFLKAQLPNAPDQSTRAVILHAMKEIRDWCPQPNPKPQGCTYVREDFEVGSGQGTICYTKEQTVPVVNKWEALVDFK